MGYRIKLEYRSIPNTKTYYSSTFIRPYNKCYYDCLQTMHRICFIPTVVETSNTACSNLQYVSSLLLLFLKAPPNTSLKACPNTSLPLQPSLTLLLVDIPSPRHWHQYSSCVFPSPL